jgi:sulfopyruvate decarboxylase TPP-binding subunit
VVDSAMCGNQQNKIQRKRSTFKIPVEMLTGHNCILLGKISASRLKTSLFQGCKS